MAKSISLSFDMTELFFNDGVEAIPPLSLSGDGVDISLDNGVLKANQSTNPNTGPDGIIRGMKDNQWTLMYSNTLGLHQLDFIGIIDLVGSKTPQVNSFNLNGKTVNIRIIGESIHVTVS